MPETSDTSAATESKMVYDVGNGMRVVAAVVFITAGLYPLICTIQRAREFLTFPALVRDHPAVGLIVVFGAVMLFWVIGFGLWAPIRVCLLPKRTEGVFASYSVEPGPKDKPIIIIHWNDGLSLACTHNDVLERSLGALESCERLRILLGPGKFVVRVERV